MWSTKPVPLHPFSTLPTDQPRKGLFRSADLASSWDPTPGCREVRPTSCRRSAGSHSRSIALPSPFVFIRGVGCLCPASASDGDCRLGGIAISFQLVPKKFKISCHSSDCFTLLSTKHFDGEGWIVCPANVEEEGCVLHWRWEFFPANTHVQPCWLSWKPHAYFWTNKQPPHHFSRAQRLCELSPASLVVCQE